jgi:hypothetical protein
LSRINSQILERLKQTSSTPETPHCQLAHGHKGKLLRII